MAVEIEPERSSTPPVEIDGPILSRQTRFIYGLVFGFVFPLWGALFGAVIYWLTVSKQEELERTGEGGRAAIKNLIRREKAVAEIKGSLMSLALLVLLAIVIHASIGNGNQVSTNVGTPAPAISGDSQTATPAAPPATTAQLQLPTESQSDSAETIFANKMAELAKVPQDTRYLDHIFEVGTQLRLIFSLPENLQKPSVYTQPTPAFVQNFPGRTGYYVVEAVIPGLADQYLEFNWQAATSEWQIKAHEAIGLTSNEGFD